MKRHLGKTHIFFTRTYQNVFQNPDVSIRFHPRGGFARLIDKQINAVEEKHQKEGGYNEKLLRKRLEYKNYKGKF